MTDKLVIPLFPLSIAVLPGEPVPLHIFEDKYKEMVAYCLESPRSRPFGISYILSEGNRGSLCRVGCALIVEDVLKRYDDGRLDIVARALSRYELHQMVHRKSYFEAQISFFEDDKEAPKPTTTDVERIVTLLCRLSELRSGRPHLVDPSDFKNFSFVAGVIGGLKNEDKQALLEMQSEQKRLVFLASKLEENIHGYPESENTEDPEYSGPGDVTIH